MASPHSDPPWYVWRQQVAREPLLRDSVCVVESEDVLQALVTPPRRRSAVSSTPLRLPDLGPIGVHQVCTSARSGMEAVWKLQEWCDTACDTAHAVRWPACAAFAAWCVRRVVTPVHELLPGREPGAQEPSLLALLGAHHGWARAVARAQAVWAVLHRAALPWASCRLECPCATLVDAVWATYEWSVDQEWVCMWHEALGATVRPWLDTALDTALISGSAMHVSHPGWAVTLGLSPGQERRDPASPSPLGHLPLLLGGAEVLACVQAAAQALRVLHKLGVPVTDPTTTLWLRVCAKVRQHGHDHATRCTPAEAALHASVEDDAPSESLAAAPRVDNGCVEECPTASPSSWLSRVALATHAPVDWHATTSVVSTVAVASDGAKAMAVWWLGEGADGEWPNNVTRVRHGLDRVMARVVKQRSEVVRAQVVHVLLAPPHHFLSHLHLMQHVLTSRHGCLHELARALLKAEGKAATDVVLGEEDGADQSPRASGAGMGAHTRHHYDRTLRSVLRRMLPGCGCGCAAALGRNAMVLDHDQLPFCVDTQAQQSPWEQWSVSYAPPWPICTLLTPTLVSRWERVGSLLLALHVATLRLNAVWLCVQKQRRVESHERRMTLLLWRLCWFVRNTVTFFTLRLHDVQQRFQHDVKAASVHELRRLLHQCSDSVTTACLLHTRVSAILTLVRECVHCAHVLCNAGVDVTPALVEEVRTAFAKAMKSLRFMLTSITQQSAKSGLEFLLSVVIACCDPC